MGGAGTYIGQEGSPFQLLCQYTRARLTTSSDKLAAISEIAREMQRHLVGKDHYVAGIWKNYLVPSLFWEVVPSRLNTQPSEYRAPSWSWASVDSPLVLLYNPVKYSGTVLADVSLIETGEIGDDSFLGLSSAFLRITGYLTPALLTPGEQDGDGVRMNIFGVEGSRTTGTLDIDPQLSNSNKDFALCIPLMLRDTKDIRGLLLKPTLKKEGEYERCGLFTTTDGTLVQFLQASRKVGLSVFEY